MAKILEWIVVKISQAALPEKNQPSPKHTKKSKKK